MVTFLGAEGWTMEKHTRSDVNPPSWAPNLGRICDAFLFYQQTMPAAGDLGLRQRWVFTARSCVQSPVQRDEVGRDGVGVALLRPSDRVNGPTRPRALWTSQEVHRTGKGLSCELKLVEASLAHAASGKWECKASEDQEGPQGTLRQMHPMPNTPSC